MRFSQSLLRFVVVLGVAVGAGCDRDVDSVMAPVKVPSGPNALIVPTGYSDVSVGHSYACAVRAVDGGLVCWGANDYGRATPPAGKYTQVSAGVDHACALRVDYVAVCWGGSGFNPSENAPPPYTYSQVSAGNVYGCGVRLDTRALACWGNNTDAMEGAPSIAYTQVSAATMHTCGVAYGTSKVTCWGQNDRGQTSVPDDVYTQVDVGSNHTCAVRSTGAIACWGSDDYGQSSPPAGTYTQVSAGQTTTCAVRASDRAVVCWGDGSGGMTSPPAGAYTEVSIGSDNACAVRTGDLALVCWGSNRYGESSPPGISTAHTPPSASFAVPASVAALDTFFLNLYSARVNGYPQATTFTYQFDCGDGKGYGAAQTANYARCPTRVAATRTVRGKVIDQDGDTASYTMTVPVNLRAQTVTFTSTAPTSPAMSTTTTPTTYTVSAKATSGLPITVSVSTLSNCTVTGTVVKFVAMGTCIIAADQKGDSTWAPARTTQTVKVIWPFSGFFTPVYNAPYVNVVPAGRYVKIPFSLAGNRGTGSFVVPSNTASSYVVTCPIAGGTNVTSFSAATPGVVYDVNTARYVLSWKTDASWAGTCRTVMVTLIDGTTHTLTFRFT